MRAPRLAKLHRRGSVTLALALAIATAAQTSARAKSSAPEPLPALDAAPPQGEQQPLAISLEDEYLLVAPEDLGPADPLGPPLLVPALPPEGALVAPADDAPADVALAEQFGYDAVVDRTTWIAGNDDRMGMLSFETHATIQPGENRGVVAGFGFHFLDGPVVPDMPPRLFDFTIGYQRREWLVDDVGFDVVVRVGAFSDFEGSARKGVRFPGHAVVFARMTPEWEWLVGVDYLDRDDISLLPVIGPVWTPHERVRIDAVFPRPCAAIRLADASQWAYVRGQLGGGTWAIVREPATINDNVTYRDLRVAVGIETRDDAPFWSAVEVGYVFARELSYRSTPAEYDLRDTVMISFTGAY